MHLMLNRKLATPTNQNLIGGHFVEEQQGQDNSTRVLKSRRNYLQCSSGVQVGVQNETNTAVHYVRCDISEGTRHSS